jgi:hypothetical protein
VRLYARFLRFPPTGPLAPLMVAGWSGGIETPGQDRGRLGPTGASRERGGSSDPRQNPTSTGIRWLPRTLASGSSPCVEIERVLEEGQRC